MTKKKLFAGSAVPEHAACKRGFHDGHAALLLLEPLAITGARRSIRVHGTVQTSRHIIHTSDRTLGAQEHTIRGIRKGCQIAVLTQARAASALTIPDWRPLCNNKFPGAPAITITQVPYSRGSYRYHYIDLGFTRFVLLVVEPSGTRIIKEIIK